MTSFTFSLVRQTVQHVGSLKTSFEPLRNYYALMGKMLRVWLCGCNHDAVSFTRDALSRVFLIRAGRTWTYTMHEGTSTFFASARKKRKIERERKTKRQRERKRETETERRRGRIWQQTLKMLNAICKYKNAMNKSTCTQIDKDRWETKSRINCWSLRIYLRIKRTENVELTGKQSNSRLRDDKSTTRSDREKKTTISRIFALRRVELFDSFFSRRKMKKRKKSNNSILNDVEKKTSSN